MSVLDENITKLESYLARFKKSGIMNRIAGIDEMGAGGMFKTISPVDKTVICEVAHGTAEDINKASKCGS